MTVRHEKSHSTAPADRRVSLARALAALAMAAALSLGCRPAFAETSTEDPQSARALKPVTVAFYEDGEYMSRSDNGDITGYNIDYLTELARHAGWSIEYRAYASWEEAYESLLAGEVDLLPSVFKTPDRAAGMLFSESSVGDIHATLSVRADDQRYAYEDFEAFDGMRVGIIEGTKDAEAFEEYCAANGFSVETVGLGTAAELVEHLEQGDVDAIATTYLGSVTDFKTVAQYYPASLFIALPADRVALKTELDGAINQLKLSEQGFFNDLSERYFDVNTAQDPVFTREEYAYMKTNRSLTVVYDSFRAPLSFTDPETGEFAGVAASLFNDISRITGLSFTFVAVDSHDEALRLVETGQADIVYGVDRGIRESPESKITVTGAYLNNAMAKIVGGNPSGNRIALPEGFVISDRIVEDNQEAEFIYYDTPKACLDAVIGGQADAAFADIHVADYLLSEPQYEKLSILTLTQYENSLCIGVSESCGNILPKILERCIQFTSSTTMNQWVSEASTTIHPLSPMDVLRQYPLQILGGTVAAFVLAIGVIIYIFRSRVRHASTISEIKYVDPLTGGWNLSRFQASAYVAIAKGFDHDHAMLYLDVRRFKSFNAAFGYAEGDRLIVALNKLLAGFCEKGECYARINADQFVALLHWSDHDAFARRFTQFGHALNELPMLQDRDYRVTVRGGASVFAHGTPVGDHVVSELIDQARYASESLGESTQSAFALYTEDMKERDIVERTIQGKAVSAFENGEFIAYYQPKVLISTGEIVGFEALVRWDSPEDGLRPPIDFVSLFEKNGFIRKIDFSMLARVCQRQRKRIDAGLPVVSIASNFSRLHLQDDRFVDEVTRIVDSYDIPHELIELELTEDLVLEDLSRAQTVCAQFKERGFRLSIDDFGSGYSSLGTLQMLPIDVLKLDRSFLMDNQGEARGQAILEGVVDIAVKLGVNIVVEGVEDLSQATMLASLDQRVIAQGYLYSPPVPQEESDRQLDAGIIEPKL